MSSTVVPAMGKEAAGNRTVAVVVRHVMHEEAVPVTRDPFTGVKIRVGVMGSAGGTADPAVLERCRRFGRAVAKHSCCLLTRACPGLPHEAALGASEAGGHTITTVTFSCARSSRTRFLTQSLFHSWV
jgi:predicted Rossmann-fold nucleotide-binding protein